LGTCSSRGLIMYDILEAHFLMVLQQILDKLLYSASYSLPSSASFLFLLLRIAVLFSLSTNNFFPVSAV
jgi:hypothetical protein